MNQDTKANQTLSLPDRLPTPESVPEQHYLELPLWVSYADKHHPQDTFLDFIYSLLIPRSIRQYLETIFSPKKQKNKASFSHPTPPKEEAP